MSKNHMSYELHLRNLEITPTDSTRKWAVICPLRDEDHGFGWGSERKHSIVPEATIESWLLGEYHRMHSVTSDRDESDAEAWASSMAKSIRECDEWPDGYDAVEVSKCIERGPDDRWPSAGMGCWGDDVWLGIADYLSHQHWCRLTGVYTEYVLPDADDLDEDALDACAAYGVPV